MIHDVSRGHKHYIHRRGHRTETHLTSTRCRQLPVLKMLLDNDEFENYPEKVNRVETDV